MLRIPKISIPASQPDRQVVAASHGMYLLFLLINKLITPHNLAQCEVNSFRLITFTSNHIDIY